MTRATDHPEVPLAPPLVFLGFLIAALGMNLLLPLPVPWLAAGRIIGMIVLVAGILPAAWAFSHMAKEHTSPDPGHPDAALLTTGVYRVTRNPIYLGFTLVFLGFTLLAGTLWGGILVPVLLLTITRLVIVPEETYLAARFPARFAEYAARVHRWL